MHCSLRGGGEAVFCFICVENCVIFFLLLLSMQCADHGFPSKPSAMAYDPKLKLVAIGTKSGVVKMYPLRTFVKLL